MGHSPRVNRTSFGGHSVEQPSGGRAARAWSWYVDITYAIHSFVGSAEAALEMVERVREAGGVEYEFHAPAGVSHQSGGVRFDAYPPGTYVVRDMADGCAVVWRLEG